MVNIEKPDFENMSDNKKYFIIGIWIFLLLLIIFFLFIWWWNENNWKKSKWVKWELSIWTVWEPTNSFNSFITNYKTEKKLTNLTIKHKNFSDLESYYYALSSAFIKNNGPDIFVMNNNDYLEQNFEEKILWLNSDDISLSDFRKNYKQIFSKELIREANVDWKKINYLIWVPLWYETISVFYNQKLFRFAKWVSSKDLLSWAWINLIIESLYKYDKSIISIWMWVWKQIKYSHDIVTSLVVQDRGESISDISKTLKNYINYRDKGTSFTNNKTSKTDIELFKTRKLAIILWYPRILEELSGMRDDSSVLASDFPKASSTNNDIFVNYNYYVINIDWKNINASKNLLAYFASEKWAKKYFSDYNKYLLPARSGIMSEIKDNKINDNFNIVFGDVTNEKYELKSFDKKISFIYDNWIKNVLDSEAYNYQIISKEFIKRIESIYRNMIIN